MNYSPLARDEGLNHEYIRTAEDLIVETMQFNVQSIEEKEKNV
jgi:hypothetical protein